MILLRCVAILVAFTVIAPVLMAAPEDPSVRIVIPKTQSDEINHEDYYFTRLLRLALDKTREQDGEYTLDQYGSVMNDDRLKAALSRKLIDVMWFTTSLEYEQRYLPIKVSLYKDLSHYRVFIIRSDKQAAFSKVASLKDLREFKGGMSDQWPDAAVMQANDLPQVFSSNYDNLFKMLAAGRFDYFSRGLYQVLPEAGRFPDLGLMVEEQLLLQYPGHFYFFVHPENTLLASRLERGLNIALEDGSFDELFYSIPHLSWARGQLDNNKRRLLILE